MQAAQILAGYSLGDADLLRRAMGKKIQSEMDAQRATLRRRLRDPQSDPRGEGQRAVRLDRQVRRLRLQQEPRRRLRAAHLPDRLAEGASPRRILRRLDELRRRADRQARRCSSRTCAAAGSSACRPTSTPATRISRSRTARSAMRWARSRASARRRWRRWSRSASAADRSPASRISPRASIRACSTAASSKALPARARSTRIKPDRAARIRRRRDDPRPCRERARPAHQRPGRTVRRELGRSRADPPAARRDLDAGAAHGGRARGVRILFLGAPGRFAAAPARRAQGEDVRRDRPRCRIAEGERIGATMAALVEETRWRTSAKGRRYMMATLSDSSRPVPRDRVR